MFAPTVLDCNHHNVGTPFVWRYSSLCNLSYSFCTYVTVLHHSWDMETPTMCTHAGHWAKQNNTKPNRSLVSSFTAMVWRHLLPNMRSRRLCGVLWEKTSRSSCATVGKFKASCSHKRGQAFEWSLSPCSKQKEKAVHTHLNTPSTF